MGNYWIDIAELDDLAEELMDVLYRGKKFKSKDAVILDMMLYLKKMGKSQYAHRLLPHVGYDIVNGFYWVISVNVY